MTTRIKFDTQIFKQYMPRSYLKLLIVFRNFVKKWKKDKKDGLLKFCVNKIIKINLKNKLRAGIRNVKASTRNLQRVGKWLQIIKQ